MGIAMGFDRCSCQEGLSEVALNSEGQLRGVGLFCNPTVLCAISNDPSQLPSVPGGASSPPGEVFI